MVQKYFGIETLGHKNHDSANHVKIDKKRGQQPKSKISDDVRINYRINNMFFYYFFSFLTHMGSEIFYILFLPLLTWVYSDKIIALTSISWAINMYLGQITKELFKMPRPTTPPVVKLDKQYINEYGFPSTHAMAAMSITFTLLALFEKSNEQLFLNYSVLQLMALCLILLISFSRIYMGMHSFLDITGGVVYSFVVTSLVLPYLENIEYLLKSSIMYGILFYSIGILLCLLYPNATRESSARIDTFIIVGVASSACLSTSLKSYLSSPIHMFSIRIFGLSQLHLIVSRVVIGFVLTFLSRLACKKIIFFTALNVFNYKKYFANGETCNIKDLVQRKYSFEFVYYFLTYSFVGFTAFFTSFFVFNIFSV
jgi:membrane-associated phospholipid phosphatase